MTNTLLMLTAMLAYSIPIAVGLLLWKFENPLQRASTATIMLIGQGLCMFFWSYAMVDREAYGIAALGGGMLIPTLAVMVYGWRKLVKPVFAGTGGGSISLGRPGLSFYWAHGAIAWAMMLVFIAMAFGV